jgi:riboflavin kinase/FMN adenylyltransferase
MKIYNEMIDLKDKTLVIGFFDAFHFGHLKIMESAKYPIVVLTFKSIFSKTKPLYSFEKRIETLEENNIKEVICLDLDLKDYSAQRFIDEFLIKSAPKEIVVGDNFYFGNDHSHAEYLKKDFDVNIISLLKDHSSTNIKKLIIDGNIENANKLLVKNYSYSNVVKKGNRFGTEFLYPTANLEIDKNCINIKYGVYYTTTLYNDKNYPSLTFIGKPKTVVDNNYRIENHILDFDENIYDKEITIIFNSKIADIVKAESIPDLKKLIKKYIDIVKNKI